MILAAMVLFFADPPYQPLPDETAACVAELAPKYAAVKETADVVADAIAQTCFFRQPYSSWRHCYVIPGCGPGNLITANEEMKRIKLEALAQVVAIRVKAL